MIKIIIQPLDGNSLGDLLKKCLKGEFESFKSFYVAVAFLKKSGFKHIQTELSEFLEKGGKTKFIIGVDHSGTTYEGLQEVIKCVGSSGEIWIQHSEETHVTFHPKLYLFEGEKLSVLVIGSNNITEGGLYTNDEASSISWLDMTNKDDLALFTSAKKSFDEWSKDGSTNILKLDSSILESLLSGGYVINEKFQRDEENKVAAAETRKTENSDVQSTLKALFGKSEIKRSAPKYKKEFELRPVKSKSKAAARKAGVKATVESHEDIAKGFVLTLQKTDVGIGQTNAGTSRRSPEIFIPLSARDHFPDFWGWRDEFTEDPDRPGKFDRTGVRMRIGAEVIQVNMMTWPIKHDFRLRSEILRSSGNIGDILRIEKVEGVEEFEYYVEVIPSGTSMHSDFLKLCTNTTRGSERLWGYYS